MADEQAEEQRCQCEVGKAVNAGATFVRELRNEFYGERTATVADPFGFQWRLSSRIETVSPSEMQARWDRMMEGA